MNKKVGMFNLAIALLVSFTINILAAKPTVKISASPTTIVIGGSSTLTWTSTGATSASINNNIGSVPVNGSKVVTPAKTTTYTITAKNSSGTATATAKVTVTATPPTVSFNAAPASISPGQSSTLSWTTTGATSVSINQGIGIVALNGTKIVSPTSTKTYTITVKGSGGTITASTTVTIAAVKPTVTISAEPMTIQPGESSTLTWTSANATLATIDNDFGAVALNSAIMVYPTVSTTYTITVSGSGGTASASATITVVQPQPQVSLHAIPMAVLPGETSTLCWQTKNVDSTTINNGVGTIPTCGSIQVSPTATTTYTLTAMGLGCTATASATVEINETLQPSVSLYSSPKIVKEGGSIVLSWNAVHAESTNIDNGIGSVPTRGSLNITLTGTATFSITASNANGTATASVKVDVKSEPKCYSYIPSGINNSVTVIDNKNALVVKTIPVGSDPSGCAVSPDGMRVYIGNNLSNSISVIDTGSNSVVSTWIIDVNPKYLALSPGGEYLYVANDYGYNIIDKVEMGTGQVATELHVGGEYEYLHGMAFHPDGSRMYVAISSLLDSGKMAVIDTNTNEVLHTIPMGITHDADCDLTVSPDGSRVYWISGPGDSNDNLFVIDTATYAVLKTSRIPQSNGTPAQLLDLAVLPDGGKLYVIAKEDNAWNPLSYVDTAAFTVGRVGYTINYPKNIGVDPDGSRVFVLSSNILNSFYTSSNSFCWGVSLYNGSVAYGNFIGYIADTVAGKVANNGVGVAGITLTAVGEGVTKTAQTDASGNYTIALGNGTYTITPSKGSNMFSPQNVTVTVNQSVSGKNFKVIDTNVPPTVTLSGSPATINVGNSATLTWTSTNAATAEIDNGVGYVPINGSITVTPTATTTYKITVSNTVLTATATAKIIVVGSVATVTISAAPATIQAGGSSTLTWISTHATAASLDNGIGIVPVNGSMVVTPSATTTYKISVTGTGGSANASVQVAVNSPYSSVLTGTVTDFSSGQPIAGVLVTAIDSASQTKTAQTDVAGKYTISSLAPGNVKVSFAKSDYDPCQQIINIPANTTFDLTTQLRLTQVGATLTGLVKDGQTTQPIAGATVTAVYSGGSLSATSGIDGSYALVGLPLGISIQITASYPGYRPKTIQQTFSYNQVYALGFVIFNESVLVTINGKIINAKTMQPEPDVKVTHEGSNIAVTTAIDGTFVFDNISFGEQTFYLEKENFINESMTYTIDHTPFPIDLIKPSSEGGQITVDQNISGVIRDSLSQLPIAGAKVRIPFLNLEAVSDANGNYSLSNLTIGNYPLIIMAVNHQSMNFMASIVPNETNKADFALVSLAKGLIKGVITNIATGKPVAEANIEISGSGLLAANSEGDGTYKMVGVPPGIYKVLVMHPEYADASVENVEVRDLTPTTVDLQLSKRPVTGALEGRILDNATGNPVNNASVTISGTMITAMTDAGGKYRLANVPAGLNDIVVSAPGYPESPRIRAVIADKDLSSSSTTSSDIRIDVNNSTINEAVTAIITANEGGDIITQDSRFLLHIFPGTLSADARITLKDTSNGPAVPIGSDLPLDPALKIEGIKAASVMTQIEISSVNEGNPAPTINGLAAFATRYAQKDTDAFQLDENTAFIYSWNGTYFTALNPRPYELAVDKINNIVYSVMDLSKTIAGSTAQYSKKTLLTVDSAKSGAVMSFATTIIIKIIGKSIKNTIIPPKPNVKIFDKNELDAVTTAPFNNIPNPNALPLLVIHGFDPSSFILGKETNPNKEERYRLMLEDIVVATNGVYRPVFVSFNTEAKISSIAQSLAEKIFGEYQNLDISFKGLPANPNDPASGTFPYLDTFGFSMGGLVSRTFIFFNKINRVHNMTMIGTPNHGTFNCLKYLFNNNSLFGVASNIVKPLNFGASDMLDYDDNNPIDGFNQNPFLFRLNSPILSSAVTPRGDINLFAGTDESAWLGLPNLFIASPHDSLVTVKSVFCRPSNATLESKLSLLKVREPKSGKYEHIKDFSHDKVGKKDKRINEFINEIALGLSDWAVDRTYDDNSPDMLPDNIFEKPTGARAGYAKSKVKVEYNVWDGSDGRTARDFDRVVLVIYHKDGNDHWHISEPKGGYNGADSNGNINESKVERIIGNSKDSQLGHLPKILDATVNFDPNPPKGASGYDPEKDIVEVVSTVISLNPGKMKVPLDPTKSAFRTPHSNE